MVAALCAEGGSQGWSDCVFEDDVSSSNKNFKFKINLEPGDYILSVSEFEYGSATYNLKYSFSISN